jgi:Ca-activated chloride channel family protein
LSELQGGEVGSGHSLLALFEIVPTDPDSTEMHDPERLARVQLNYRLPHDARARLSSYDCGSVVTPFRDLQPCYRFASSIALFGGLLKKSRFTHQADWKDAIQMAEQSSDPEDPMQQEFITLIEKARKIYGHSRRHRKEED